MSLDHVQVVLFYIYSGEREKQLVFEWQRNRKLAFSNDASQAAAWAANPEVPLRASLKGPWPCENEEMSVADSFPSEFRCLEIDKSAEVGD